ncbi:bacterial regulatory helix-turn-helix protein, lysR family domain-containing protein [Ditylenchus destructor]|nr:bacterial regulatory helix-turn-helix protein, lysR family domain-containing protein [Ditylenchus destructor]
MGRGRRAFSEGERGLRLGCRSRQRVMKQAMGCACLVSWIGSVFSCRRANVRRMIDAQQIEFRSHPIPCAYACEHARIRSARAAPQPAQPPALQAPAHAGALGSSLNLHRASLSLAMSQPAATRMLREIEDMFGCQLFERLPRGMRPTALGAQLVRFAEASLNSLDRCAEDLAARRQGGYGYLSIGTIMGAAPDLVMTAVARMKAQSPQLRLRIMGDTSDQILRRWTSGASTWPLRGAALRPTAAATASRNWATSGCWSSCAAAIR